VNPIALSPAAGAITIRNGSDQNDQLLAECRRVFQKKEKTEVGWERDQLMQKALNNVR